MNADEFRKILDRLLEHLTEAGNWALSKEPESVDTPQWYTDIGADWRDLSRECSRMKDAEGRKPADENDLHEREDMTVSSEENAKQIGELQGGMSEIGGQVLYLTGLIAALQGTVIEVQQREVERLARAAKALDSPS